MKFCAVSKESKVSFALLALMYLLIITYTYICVLLKVPIEPETSERPRVVRRSLGWRELLKTWDYNFRLKIESTGPIVFTYPDAVKFILNEVHACEEDFLVLALVVTAIQNHQRRHFIRHTWGHSAVVEKTGIKPLFIVGQPKQQRDQLSLEEESHQHHDILQANFIDDYQNLTYKTTAILHWASTSCPNVPLLLKIDDDVIPNPFALSDYLVFYLQRNPQPVLILGKVRCCDPVLRVGKWAVSEKKYNRSGYPPYVAGPSYIVPSAVIPALLQAAKKTRKMLDQ
ncbi:UDP-GlcNAc:betaGal beta-1,3-N-acetylglucosaminyltransferase 7-like isoform X2 [Macrobrachium nipponense]|uniref:UDP-GlcNAc:betaGal beta-1,3-N-acetylglucosaminyltransferase 7-like isoform X2 n=1 Tax=Macrobrachium nipponense TaxID=159736 RepID=UPI0030C8A40F